MGTISFGRLKRRNGGDRSGSGVKANFLKSILPPGGTPRARAESDTALVRQALLLQLALKALDRAIADYCGVTRQRRPSYAALAQYLDDCERGLESVPARIAGASR